MTESDTYNEHHNLMVMDDMRDKLAGIEEVLRKMLADIVESHDTSNFDGGDLRRWAWTLQELLEIPRDQR